MLKNRFLKQMNLIKIIFKFKLKSTIVYKIIFNRFNFINKKYKFVDVKKNIYKNSYKINIITSIKKYAISA